MQRTISTSMLRGMMVMVLAGAAACDPTDRIAGTGDETAGGPMADHGTRIPPAQVLDRLNGNGKLDDGHDFATFGFDVRSGRGTFEWVQYCPDGVTSNPTCAYGPFTFRSATVTTFTVDAADPAHCGSWTGTGVATLGDPDMAALYDGTYDYQVERACDLGEPGRGTDRFSLSISSYHRDGVLTAGNIQSHADHNADDGHGHRNEGPHHVAGVAP